MAEALTYPAYFEQRYCDACMCVHWLEITPARKEICHGEDYYPLKPSPAHYAKRSGRGFKLIAAKPQPLPLEWQILAERPTVLDEVDF